MTTKMDTRVILELSEYDQQMAITILLFAYRDIRKSEPYPAKEQYMTWIKEMLLRIDPINAEGLIAIGETDE